MYIWQRAGWPNFHWNSDPLMEPLAKARLKQGRLLGRMATLGFDLKVEAHMGATTEDVLRSSEIEGETFNRASVRSSLARRLGVPEAGTAPFDRRADGVVEMMLDATGNFAAPLSEERLIGWHAALFPVEFCRFHPVKVGGWRDDSDGPREVVSGPVGRLKVLYRAPPAPRLEEEMKSFLEWFNRGNEPEGLLRAGLAHLWFVTIHPFDDGNGRIARAIADQALAQSEDSGQRFYSMSAQILKERSDYYEELEGAQKSGLDVTNWLLWFLGCLTRSIDSADSIYKNVLLKADFWKNHAQTTFSDRQKKLLTRYLDGFDGKMTAKKWAAIGKCSVPTAQRDINDLAERNVLQKNPGRSKNTSYDLVAGS